MLIYIQGARPKQEALLHITLIAIMACPRGSLWCRTAEGVNSIDSIDSIDFSWSVQSLECEFWSVQRIAV